MSFAENVTIQNQVNHNCNIDIFASDGCILVIAQTKNKK